MKLTTVLIFMILMQVHANGLAQRLTFSKRSTSLKEIFVEINKQTGYNIIWSADELRKNEPLDVNFKNTPLQEVLTTCLKRYGLAFVIKSNTIVIKDQAPAAQVAPVQPPSTKLSGKVTDTLGRPLPGATIVLKGTTKGTIAKPDGTFQIDVSPGDVLRISFLGYTAVDITIGSQTFLDIKLKESDGVMAQTVVVTALGIKREARSLTYNVQELGGSELTTVKDANFVNSLAGKVAGVTINASSSGIGGGARVVMRGTKSIAGNNNALYVIDGIPLPNLTSPQPEDIYSGANQTGDGISNFNPEDIESVSVLTGAAASALYGSDAANGVVMITTKKGSAGKMSVNISNSTSFYSPFVMPKFQNTYGSETESYYSWGSKLATPSSYDPTDFFRTGVNVTNSISLSTGNEKNQTYLSASTVTAKGIIPNNDLQRYSLSIRNSSKFMNDKLSMDVSLMYFNVSEKNMLAQGQYSNPLIPVYLFPRGDDFAKYQVYERYDFSRNFKTQFWPFGDMGLSMQNPYWIS